ncbi:MAG: class I adenylate-forming enzyme family protein [Paracoccaceae bacterium]
MLDFAENQTAPSMSFAHASVDVLGRLPRGDARIWAQSLTDVIAAAMQDGRLNRIRDVSGDVLEAATVVAAWDRMAGQGIAPGDVVIADAVNSVPAAAQLLALWLHGCTVVPVDPALPPDTLAMIAGVAGAQAFVSAEGDVRALATPRAAGTIRLCRPLRVTGVDMAMMIFTSGSSGTPKGVALTHANILSALRAIATYQRLTPQDRIMAIPPFFFDYGLYQMFLSLFTGCELILSGTARAVSKLAPMIARARPTILPVVPALATGIARVLEITGVTVDSVRLVTNTGGHLPEASIQLLASVFPRMTAMPMYGLTESKRVMYCDRARWPDAADSCGVAMPGLLAKLLVDDGTGLRETRVDETGELHVRGSSVMQGYRGDTSTASARLIEGAWRSDVWLSTGDLMSRDADGLHYFRGRSKSLIKQAGYCIAPRDLEKMAEALPEVGAAVVVGRTEADGDETVVMFIEPAREGAALDARGFKTLLKAHFPPSLMPRVVALVAEWPATPNGKVCLKTLAKMAEGLK